MNSTHEPALAQLESATRDFRDRLAKGHRARWVAEHRRARRALDDWGPIWMFDPETGEVRDTTNTARVAETMTDALSVAKWHQGRDNGQKYRFRKLEQCGTRTLIAHCKNCEGDRKPVLEGCGISRLCVQCSLRNAKKRRGRFGRARARVSVQLARIGYTKTRKHQKSAAPGGVWSDKMMTFTVPHFLLSHVERGAEFLKLGKAHAVDATMARIYAVRAAWPLFSRGLARWFKLGGTLTKPKPYDVPRAPIAMPLKDGTFVPPPMHRAFEWTVGGDGLGHPHFHVWLLGPYVPEEILMRLWRDALIAVGVPLERDAYVRVEIKRFRDFDGAAVGELIKSGNRKALEWSRLYKHGPKNAFEYADGWTIAAALEHAAPAVVASLYMALEGARLTQASRGFFEADEAPACAGCGAQGCWHVRFEAVGPPEIDAERLAIILEGRGPP